MGGERRLLEREDKMERDAIKLSREQELKEEAPEAG